MESNEAAKAVKTDSSNNRYLKAALAGGAPYIVSGDRHLLDLQQYRGIQILAPNEFVAFLKLQRLDLGSAVAA